MTYDVALTDDVAAQASLFEDETLRYWNACLAEIATDPLARSGVYVDRIIPIRGFPMRTYIYEIREETSISGERIFVFLAEFFPEVGIVYIVDEGARTCSSSIFEPMGGDGDLGDPLHATIGSMPGLRRRGAAGRPCMRPPLTHT